MVYISHVANNSMFSYKINYYAVHCLNVDNAIYPSYLQPIEHFFSLSLTLSLNLMHMDILQYTILAKSHHIFYMQFIPRTLSQIDVTSSA